MSEQEVTKSQSDSTVIVKTPSHINAVSDNRISLSKPYLEGSEESKAFEKPAESVLGSAHICRNDGSGSESGERNFKTCPSDSPSAEVTEYTIGLTATHLRQRKPLQTTQNEEEDKTTKKPTEMSQKPGVLETTKASDLSKSLYHAELQALPQGKKTVRSYYACWMILTMLSLMSRLYNIEMPKHVCWDETHFGKMGSWYINRTFFFDVHPPLGKMLIGLSGVATGYNGSFPFEKPGDPYEDDTYVGMRMFCALLGAALVPLAFQSVWLLTHSTLAALLAGAFILTDTGTLTLSRHILLDPILMFFILLSTYCCLKALAQNHRPFSPYWWIWMSATGTALAGAIGVKFVGLFIILFIGYTTAADLWRLLGDFSVSMKSLFAHVSARAVCLIVLPIYIYCCFYVIHFKVLNQSGNGDGFFSSAFQSQLKGNNLYRVNMPQYIAYGTVITLKQQRTGGAYLHSHSHLYPEEHPPKQQQVTTYSHKDDNNQWLVKPADKEVDIGAGGAPTMVHSGDLIRLEHVATRRNLHSHREVAPLSRHHFQVSGYGLNGSGDANDIWVLEVVGGARGDKIETVRSKLRLTHYNVGCLLSSHDKKLPKWGWEQLEVTCQPDQRDKTAAWNIEEVIDARFYGYVNSFAACSPQHLRDNLLTLYVPNSSFELYSPSFLEKFIESHAVMTQGNSGLKPKDGELTSQPWQWPLDYRGQTFSGTGHRIYMLGNPILFWWLLGSKGIFLLLWLGFRLCQKRGVTFTPAFTVYYQRMIKVCWWLLLGWFLHYAPFWTMSRVLYFHHYFPAFLFSAMFGGVLMDFLLTLICITVPHRLAKSVFITGLVLVLSTMAGSLYLFHPIVYGMPGPTSDNPDSIMYGLKWLESWEF